MPEHRIGTRKEWQVARDALAKLEAEQAERNEEVKSKRRDLPWVPVEKEYVFDTEDGKKTLAELFDGRSLLLAGTDRAADRLQAADGLGVPLRLHLQHRLRLRLRSCDDAGAGAADPPG